jgi:hypothetical protein
MLGYLQGRPRTGDIEMHLFSGHLGQQDHGPVAPLLLAIRALRRALADNPDDTTAYLRLGQVYGLLTTRTQERYWGQRLPLLGGIRHAQRIFALEQALILNPDLTPAREQLALLFRDMHFLDVSLGHFQEYVRLEMGNGPRDGELPLDYQKRVDRLKTAAKSLEDEVVKQRRDFHLETAKAPVMERARKARQKGLAREALDILLGSTIDVFKQEGAQMQIELMLILGRVREAQEMLTPELKGFLGMVPVAQLEAELPAFLWYRTVLAAALGDYREADERLAELQEFVQQQRAEHVALAATPARPSLAGLLGFGLAAGPGQPLAWRALSHCLSQDILAERLMGVGHLRQSFKLNALGRLPALEANLGTLRGVLALEAGDPAAAERHFVKALRDTLPFLVLSKNLGVLGAQTLPDAVAYFAPLGYETGIVYDFEGEPLVSRYLRLMEQAKSDEGGAAPAP